jgi:hypothetical protein
MKPLLNIFKESAVQRMGRFLHDRRQFKKHYEGMLLQRKVTSSRKEIHVNLHGVKMKCTLSCKHIAWQETEM